MPLDLNYDSVRSFVRWGWMKKLVYLLYNSRIFALEEFRGKSIDVEIKGN